MTLPSSSASVGTIDRETRIKRLFESVAPLTGHDRTTALERARRDDPDACAEVEELLSFHDRTDGVLDRSIVGAAQALSTGLMHLTAMPEKIGPFRVLRELGHGGMGVVYEAEQEFPKRRVALKVIRSEFVSRELLRRFTLEAETLALLHHPGIAQLYQAGFAEPDQNRPYIAMELVEGKTLLAHAAGSEGVPPLDVPDKLELIAKVCDAVDHAHRRGVIHRDLKPSNIIVTTGAQPKVLDFGVARLIASGQPSSTLSTSVGQIVGTMGYMSPEQLLGDPRHIDTRSDIYALGVILSELLTGSLPIDVSKMSLAKAAIAVRDQEPVRLGWAHPQLRGDIEAIVGKTLEKDAARRYASAADLAADLRRVLRDQPVEARPQTSWYRFWKFTKRNKALVTAATLSILILTAASIGTTWQAIRATRASRVATEQSTRAQQSLDVLKTIFMSATPEYARGKEITVRELLNSAARDIEAIDATSPVGVAEAHTFLAQAYHALAEFELSAQHGRRAMAMFDKLGARDTRSAFRAASVTILALSSSILRETTEASALADEVYPRAVQVLGPDDPDTIELMAQRALAYQASTRFDESVSMWRAVVEAASNPKVAKDSPLALTHYRQCLARALLSTQKKSLTSEAEELLRIALEDRRRLQGADHPRTLSVVQNLGRVLINRRAFEDALALENEHIDIVRRVIGPDNPSTLAHEVSLAEAYEGLKRHAEALPFRRHIYQTYTDRNGPTDLQAMAHRMWLCACLLDLRHWDDAEPLVQQQMDLIDGVRTEDEVRVHMRAIAFFHRFRIAVGRENLEAARAAFVHVKGTMYERKAAEALREFETKLGIAVETPPAAPPPVTESHGGG